MGTVDPAPIGDVLVESDELVALQRELDATRPRPPARSVEQYLAEDRAPAAARLAGRRRSSHETRRPGITVGLAALMASDAFTPRPELRREIERRLAVVLARQLPRPRRAASRDEPLSSRRWAARASELQSLDGAHDAEEALRADAIQEAKTRLIEVTNDPAAGRPCWTVRQFVNLYHECYQHACDPAYRRDLNRKHTRKGTPPGGSPVSLDLAREHGVLDGELDDGLSATDAIPVELVHQFISKLSPEDANLLVMVDWEAMSKAEAARQLGRTPEWARQRYKRLREFLEPLRNAA